MKYRKIPDETIRRMPRYLRAFSQFALLGGEFVSSGDLAEQLRLNGSQIRKDLSYFGAFGTRGVGYPVSATGRRIRQILKLNVRQKAALVGAGRLGTAIAAYPGFKMYGFDIAAIFDNSPKKIGKKIGAITIQDISKLGEIRSRRIRLAILAVPAEAAQACADALAAAGVGGILNLSPAHLKVSKKIRVVNIDLAAEMSALTYYL